jgi:D-alanyl-D-alanine carboxypeptidase
MKPGDLFRVGSITKSFVATLVLMLRAEGKVSLDSPVSRYVEGVPGGVGMTVRQILNHTSGLPDYTESEAFWDAVYGEPTRVWKPRDLIAVAAESKAYFAPGMGWHYSNTDYIVAGLLVEEVGGSPLAEQLRARILDPQGLTQTYFDGEEPAAPGLIHGYEIEDERRVDATWVADPSWAWAAGAMVSNIDDLARFYSRLFAGEVLAPAELAEMTTWARTTWPAVPGYGLGLSRRPLAGGYGEGHEGGIMGYVTASFAIPDLGAEVTVLTNLGSGDAARIASDLSKILKEH